MTIEIVTHADTNNVTPINIEDAENIAVHLITEKLRNSELRYVVAAPSVGYRVKDMMWTPIAPDTTASLESYSVMLRTDKHRMHCIDCGEPLTYANIGYITTASSFRGSRVPVAACKKCCAAANMIVCDHPGCLLSYCVLDGATGESWCQDHALKHGYVLCCHSGYLVKQTDATKYGNWWIKNEYVSKIRFQCEHCGKPIVNTNGYTMPNGTKFCSSGCAVEHGYRTCARCGRWHHEDDLIESSEYTGGDICEECEDALRYEIHTREPSKVVAAATRGVKPTFGFEVELYRWPEESHRDWLPRTWGIHEDTTTGSGYEVLTPVLHLDEFSEKLNPTMDYLSAHSEVTRKEGTHMHVGNFKDIDHAMRFFQLCVQSEPLWATWLVSKSRRDNQYCLNTADSVIMMRTTGFHTASRYVKVNAQSYSEHGTVEIRAHHGTLDYVKMHAWAQLFNKLWFHALEKKTMPRITNMQIWLDDIGIHQTLQRYFQTRIDDLWGSRIDLVNATPNHTKVPMLYLYGNEHRNPTDVNTTWDAVYNLGITGYKAMDIDDRILWMMLGDALECDENGREMIALSNYMSLRETEATTANTL